MLHMYEPWNMLNERSQTQKPHIVWFLLHEMSKMSNLYREKVD